MNRALYDDMFRQALGPKPTDERYQCQREMADELNDFGRRHLDRDDTISTSD